MYKLALIAIGLLVIFGIFAFQNRFDNAKTTAVRGVIAIVVGWAIVILASLLVNKADLSVVTAAADILAIEEKNGARMLGAMFFGWAYPLIFVELIWGSVYLYRYCKQKNFFNSKLLSVK